MPSFVHNVCAVRRTLVAEAEWLPGGNIRSIHITQWWISWIVETGENIWITKDSQMWKYTALATETYEKNAELRLMHCMVFLLLVLGHQSRIGERKTLSKIVNERRRKKRSKNERCRHQHESRSRAHHTPVLTRWRNDGWNKQISIVSDGIRWKWHRDDVTNFHIQTVRTS